MIGKSIFMVFLLCKTEGLRSLVFDGITIAIVFDEHRWKWLDQKAAELPFTCASSMTRRAVLHATCVTNVRGFPT